jgi:hypothetical protein
LSDASASRHNASRPRHLPFLDPNRQTPPPHARSPPGLHAPNILPYEPSVTPLPEPAIQGRGSFPTHGIRIRCHCREHLRLPHLGECHKWVLRDLSCCCHPRTSDLPHPPVMRSSRREIHRRVLGPPLKHLHRGPPLRWLCLLHASALCDHRHQPLPRL